MKNKLTNLIPKTQKTYIYFSLSILLVIGGGAIYLIDTSSCRDCVFSQGGIRITNSEYNKAIKTRQIFYSFNKQEISVDVLENDVLKQLKDEKIIKKYAKENNITVSQSEVEDLYLERVRQNKSEEELLARIRLLYGYAKEDYKKVLEYDILREKVQLKINEPLNEWLSRQHG